MSKPAGLTINKLIISNYMKVEALTIMCEGNHVIVSGPNASGKTSVVNALFDGLKGCAVKDATDLIHEGAKSADITIQLGDKYVVSRRITPSGPKLIVTDTENNRVARPSELLESMLSDYSLDPGKFLTMSDAEQIGVVLRLAGVKPPLTQVRDIVGEEIPALPEESAYEYIHRIVGNNTGQLYLRRRDLSRTADQKQQALTEATGRLAQVGGAIKPDEEVPNIKNLTTELGKLTEAKTGYDELVAIVGKAEYAKGLADGKVTTATKAVTDSIKNETSLREQIADLQTRLNSQVNCTKGAQAMLQTINKEVDAAAEALNLAKNSVAAVVDPNPELEAVQAKLEDAGKNAAKLERRKTISAEVHRINTECQDAGAAVEELTQAIDQIRDLRASLIEDKAIGIKNLRVGDGELTLNGRSFKKCASFAERLRVGCAIGMKEKPEVRILRMDNGEHLDAESKKMVFELAEREGFQVFMTSVSDTGGLKVEIVDKE